MRHCYVLDVFTRHGAGGNPLGVVTDTSGLPDLSMQTTAVNLGFSETVFVDWREGGIPKTRIFGPGGELPFAGHPLVGAAYVLNVLGPGGVTTLRCPAGDVGVDVSGDRVTIAIPPGDRGVRAADLGALEGWVDPISVDLVESSPSYLLVELERPEDVASAAQAPSGHVLLWAWNGDDVKARFFAPDLHVLEDPATGGAAIALGVLLTRRGMPSGHIFIRQGDEIGTPSEIELRWEEHRLWVGGAVAHRDTRVLDV